MPEEKPSFVLDASVIINFLGSGIPEQILESLNANLFVAEPVFKEVMHDPSKRVSLPTWLQQIEAQGLIEVIKLRDEALALYLELVAELPPDHLDDGEAATIAVAIQLGAIPVLDEKRARRIFQSRYPHLPLSSTAALFQYSGAIDRISQHEMRGALFHALSIARMQVQPELIDWVIGVIGEENAKLCPSLPKRFRSFI